MNVLGHADTAKLLDSILPEQNAADERLTKVAEGGLAQQAADAGGDEEVAEDEAPAMAKR